MKNERWRAGSEFEGGELERSCSLKIRISLALSGALAIGNRGGYAHRWYLNSLMTYDSICLTERQMHDN